MPQDVSITLSDVDLALCVKVGVSASVVVHEAVRARLEQFKHEAAELAALELKAAYLDDPTFKASADTVIAQRKARG